MRPATLLAVALVLVWAARTGAQEDTPPEPADEAAALAKKLQNPVADLISVPFQLNYDERYGDREAGRFTLNVQPVIPIGLNEDWNLVTRWILPVVYQPPVYQGDESDFGLGNFNLSFFFVNQVSPTLMIGAGPEAPADDQWRLPFGGGVGRVFDIGSQPVNMSPQAYDNV